MRSKVVEIPSARYVRLQPPWQLSGMLVVKVARGHCEPYLDVDHVADDTVVDNRLHLLEIRKIAPVVSHEARDAGLLAYPVHPGTVFVVCCQGLFHIHGLACLHCHNGECGMARRWCGNVYGVDVRVVDKLLRVCIPLADMVALGVAACLVLATAHDGLYAGAFNLRKGRPALRLCDFPATDKAPFQYFHN